MKKLNEPLPGYTEKDVSSRMSEIVKLLHSVSPDLQSLNRHRYAWQMRCLEELVEALAFQHYLQHQALITGSEAQAAVPGVELTPHDYLFGVFDVFGEMMRFATVAAAQGRLAGERTILADVQELACAYEMLREIPTKDYRFKMEAMRQSVNKVEKLGYGLAIRGSEGARFDESVLDS